jgi:hypothetical protein
MGKLNTKQVFDRQVIVMNKGNQNCNRFSRIDCYPLSKAREDLYKNNKLTIMHQNIRGIMNKVD